jgi:hypothetical protein
VVVIFLLEYDRKQGRLTNFQQFPNLEHAQAAEMRLQTELDLRRRGIEREVLLLEADDEQALRRTHGRYFSDLKHLVAKMDAIQGRFLEEQEEFRRHNSEVDAKVRAFLHAFDGVLNRHAERLQDLKILVQRSGPQQGRHHVWLAEVGPKRTEGAYFYQNDLMGAVKKPLTSQKVILTCGVCLRVDIARTSHGTRYELRGPIEAAVAVSINSTEDLLKQTKIAGDHKIFTLGGAEQDKVIRTFSDLLESALAPAVEDAIDLLQVSQPS